MDEQKIEVFYTLKQLVLKKYQERYPSIELNWKNFSSKDIQQLIDDIVQNTNQRVSEKWIYTHLKPETNQKLPRVDMLDILANYVEEKSWNEYFQHSIPVQTKKKQGKKIAIILILLATAVTSTIVLNTIKRKNSEKAPKITIRNSVTKELIPDTLIQLYIEESLKNEPIVSHSKGRELSSKKIQIEGPFYKDPIVKQVENTEIIEVTPVDNAHILKAYFKAPLNDWETRKEKLQHILSEDLVVYIYLENHAGIEYLNREEFISKLTIPSSRVKRWSLLNIMEDKNEKITKIRISQN